MAYYELCGINKASEQHESGGAILYAIFIHHAFRDGATQWDGYLHRAEMTLKRHGLARGGDFCG